MKCDQILTRLKFYQVQFKAGFFSPISYLSWKLLGFNQIIDESTIIDDEIETLRCFYGKVLVLRQTYELMKCHREYIYNNDILQLSFSARYLRK